MFREIIIIEESPRHAVTKMWDCYLNSCKNYQSLLFYPLMFIFLVRTLLTCIKNVDPKFEFPLFSLKHFCVGKTYTYHPSRSGVLREAGRFAWSLWRLDLANTMQHRWRLHLHKILQAVMFILHVTSFLMVNCHSVNSFHIVFNWTLSC